MTVGIAGTRYFEPLVWDKVPYFRFKYDSNGRVQRALEIAGRNGAPTGFSVQFDWAAIQLQAVRSANYSRTLRYEEGRLVAEEIQSGGKSARIKYSYNAGRLVSAICTNDPTLDDRSRQVSFR